MVAYSFQKRLAEGDGERQTAGFDVGGVLDRLDARGGDDAQARDAARLIRRLLEQVSTAEAEYAETEFSRMALVDEVDRVLNMRRAFEERRLLKAARR